MSRFASFKRAVCLSLWLLSTSCAIAGCVVIAKRNSPAPPTPPRPLFSEDFESGQLNPALWSQEITGSNLIQIQQTKVAHGKYALRVSCPAPSNKTWAFISLQNLPEPLRKHHFGRAYMFMTQPPARHTIFIMAGTPGFPQNKFQEIATNDGRWQLTYVDLHPTGDNEDYHAGPALPVGRWFCLEWEFNDNPNHTSLWIDGQPVFETNFTSKVTGQSQNLVGAFTNYAFGFRLWGSAPAPFDIFFDDIALDTHRLGPIPQ